MSAGLGVIFATSGNPRRSPTLFAEARDCANRCIFGYANDDANVRHLAHSKLIYSFQLKPLLQGVLMMKLALVDF